MYFCDKWHRYVDWTKADHVTDTLPANAHVLYLENSNVDSNGNRKWPLSSSAEIRDLMRRISEEPPGSVLFLPFDQSAGLLAILLNRADIRAMLRRVFMSSIEDQPIVFGPSLKEYACIHVRRGDVDELRHPQFYVSDSFYKEVVNVMDRHLPPSFSICICTQGSTSWVDDVIAACQVRGREVFVSSTEQAWINDNEVHDFYLMARSTVLLAAGSSFSRLASIVGNQKINLDVDKNGSPPLSSCHVLSTDPSLTASLIQSLREILLHQNL